MRRTGSCSSSRARRRPRCSRGSSRARTPTSPPRCWTAGAWRSSPTPERSMADQVWLLRHAETEWSRSGQHTGRTDIPLTDAGRDVARGLGERLAGEDFAFVLCSPLSRARETARLAGLACSGLRDDLLEWDYGEYEGLTTRESRTDRPDWFLWRD